MKPQPILITPAEDEGTTLHLGNKGGTCEDGAGDITPGVLSASSQIINTSPGLLILHQKRISVFPVTFSCQF